MTHLPIRLFITTFLIIISTFFAAHALNNNRSYADDYWLEWKEDELTSIPDLQLKGAIEVEVDARSQIKWYVDPKSIAIGEDSVVRYVVFTLSSTGTVNAMYEGILCKEGTYKTYARFIGNKDQKSFEWRKLEDPKWKNAADLQPSAHERVFAFNYMCESKARADSVSVIIKKLKNKYNVSPNPARR